jgi:hypothetical protein
MSGMTDQTDEAPQPTGAWRPPKQRDSNLASIIVGLVILGIGIWYFLGETLGFQMPRISWGDLWPIILIILGGVILYRSAANRR